MVCIKASLLEMLFIALQVVSDSADPFALKSQSNKWIFSFVFM